MKTGDHRCRPRACRTRNQASPWQNAWPRNGLAGACPGPHRGVHRYL